MHAGNVMHTIMYIFYMHAAAVSLFSKRNDSTTQGLPYDFGSCMQFSFDAYSKNNLPTIVSKNFDFVRDTLAGMKLPSEQDYLDINLTYCGKILYVYLLF